MLEGVEFVPSWDRPSVPGSLTLLKSAHMVQSYEQLFAAHPKDRIVELGISQGGSVALLALLATPTKLVAIELDERPIAPLAQVLTEHGLDGSVRPYYGVDQGDKARLSAILDDEFGTEPLDLVFDDASHLYAPTVASFEVLFPRLRPGGAYIIEDWTWQDLWAKQLVGVMADPDAPGHTALVERAMEVEAGRIPRERPVSRIALELVLAQAHAGGAVADLTIDDDWILVHRGEADLDPAEFSLASLYADAFKLLVP